MLIEILKIGSLAKDEQTFQSYLHSFHWNFPQAMIESPYKKDPNRKDGWYQKLSELWLGLEDLFPSRLAREVQLHSGTWLPHPLILGLQGKDEQSLLLKSWELLFSNKVARGRI